MSRRETGRSRLRNRLRQPCTRRMIHRLARARSHRSRMPFPVPARRLVGLALSLVVLASPVWAKPGPAVRAWLSDLVTRIDAADRAGGRPGSGRRGGTVVVHVEIAPRRGVAAGRGRAQLGRAGSRSTGVAGRQECGSALGAPGRPPGHRRRRRSEHSGRPGPLSPTRTRAASATGSAARRAHH